MEAPQEREVEAMSENVDRIKRHLDALIEAGFTRSEAFTLIRDSEAAGRGITSLAYPVPEPSTAEIEQERWEWKRTESTLRKQIELLERVNLALQEELKPYLTTDDIEQVVKQAIKEPA